MFFILILFSTAVLSQSMQSQSIPVSISNPIHIIAAENFYGEIAKQIGGQYVQVQSIMNNPNQDPHLFSANIQTAKAIADADVIIYNGIDYDPWMKNLIEANGENNNKIIIIVANLAHKKTGDNPHIWYDHRIILIYAEDLTKNLIKLDADHAHQQYYKKNLDDFKKDVQRLSIKINSIKNQYQNTPVIATEPVFAYMSDMLGFKMLGEQFQLSIMNNTSPSAEETKNFEDKLRLHQVKILFYNKQVNNPITQRMKDIAKQSHIPVIGISEMQPLNQDYITWMISQLDDVDKVLSLQRSD